MCKENSLLPTICRWQFLTILYAFAAVSSVQADNRERVCSYGAVAVAAVYHNNTVASSFVGCGAQGWRRDAITIAEECALKNCSTRFQLGLPGECRIVKGLSHDRRRIEGAPTPESTVEREILMAVARAGDVQSVGIAESSNTQTSRDTTQGETSMAGGSATVSAGVGPQLFGGSVTDSRQKSSSRSGREGQSEGVSDSIQLQYTGYNLGVSTIVVHSPFGIDKHLYGY